MDWSNHVTYKYNDAVDFTMDIGHIIFIYATMTLWILTTYYSLVWTMTTGEPYGDFTLLYWVTHFDYRFHEINFVCLI